MNTNLLHRIRLYVCLALLGVAACTEQVLLPDTGTDGTDIPTGTLRFRVADTATRVSYNDVRSTFDDDELIGCVIATKEGETVTYAANSKWHYYGGYLILDEVFTWGNYDWSNSAYSKNVVSNIISRAEANTEDGFLTLQGTGPYVFYFYYPYIDDSVLTTDYQTAYDKFDSEASVPFYQLPTYPNRDNSKNMYHEENQWNITNTKLWSRDDDANYAGRYMLMGIADQDESSSNTIPTYAWTTYPCFVNHTQRAKEQINNSDFLWVASDEITASSTGTKRLTFEKKTATIEIDSEAQLTDVYFQAKAEQSLLRGKQIDLQTGWLTDYDYSTTWGSTIQQQYMYFSTGEQILPYDADNSGTSLRVVMPAQSSFPCTLHFTLDNHSYTIDLSTNISGLEEGKRYIIHITPKGETTFEIVDWENDGFEILDPNEDFESVANDDEQP